MKLTAFPDIEINLVTQNTKQVSPGSLFVAIRGAKFDGHDYLAQAIAAGAVAVIVEDASKIPTGSVVAVKVVPDSREALDQVAAEFYGNPSERMFCFGVTGTNGKTSITYMLEWVCQKMNIPCGVLGTINHHLKDQIWPSDMTTPETVALQARLAEMKAAGARAIAMEVSSHALDQHRADAVEINTAIFTNLTRDHLDYHREMKDYFLSKQKLFTDLMWKNQKPHFAVVNIDDPWGARLKVASNATIWSYGTTKAAAFVFEVIGVDFMRTDFLLRTPFGDFKSFIPMCGTHNVANAVAVIAACASANIPLDMSIDALTTFPGVPGRLQMVPNSKALYVFVDYAHTPDALENVLSSLQAVRKQSGSASRIWTIFGCGGDRDKGKRPLMAQKAAAHSDFVMVTSDNPRTEDANAIIADVMTGFKAEDKRKVFSEANRKEAIRKVLSEAAPHDVILIAGKGHEDYQIVGSEKFKFSDYDVAKELMT